MDPIEACVHCALVCWNFMCQQGCVWGAWRWLEICVKSSLAFSALTNQCLVNSGTKRMQLLTTKATFFGEMMMKRRKEMTRPKNKETERQKREVLRVNPATIEWGKKMRLRRSETRQMQQKNHRKKNKETVLPQPVWYCLLSHVALPANHLLNLCSAIPTRPCLSEKTAWIKHPPSTETSLGRYGFTIAVFQPFGKQRTQPSQEYLRF